MDDKNFVQDKPKKSGAWIWAILGIAVLSAIILFFLRGDEDTWIKDKYGNWIKHGNPSEQSPDSSSPLTIPDKIMKNKFGFLGGGENDKGDMITESGAAWVRPHPGAFVWDMVQKSSSGEIDFTLTDEEITNYQKNNLGILVTLWPFADWDQKNLTDAASCKVADNDEFLPENDKKGRGSYLPQYRCNPSDWIAYQKFIEAVVERYDGDGTDDMPGLKMPVKYWEVMNEPDLQYQNNMTAISETSSLNFYKQGPSEYGQLLIKTSEAIRLADGGSKVLIAGAAGADSRMLNFYREVLKNNNTLTAFDIGNIHCISNDRGTNDFNVNAYKNMLLGEFNITKPIWVTEAEAMYGTTGEANYLSTKKSTEGAITVGAERIFYTRYTFDDFRTDMSQKTEASVYPNAKKYKEIIEGY